MLKNVVKPVYHFVHDALFSTLDYNPLFRQKQNGQKIPKGHISADHLNHPELDDELEQNLIQAGIQVAHHQISATGYAQYMEKANYPDSYYGGGKDTGQNFVEKTLEHYVSTAFMDLKPNSVLIDIAACTSPFHRIVRQLFGVQSTYQQDLVYPKGLHDQKIGGYAHEIPFEPNTVDAVTLHCSLEHFEGNSDTLFFQTMERVLKPGGRVIVLPFYIANEYTIHVDPVFNLLKRHKPKGDDKAQLRYCNWYQYFSRHYNVRHLQSRILQQAPNLNLTVYRVDNFRKVHPASYLRWIGVFEKTG